MCGIFGIASCGKTSFGKAAFIRKATTGLLTESQIRGRRASGLCVLTAEKAFIYKHPLSAEELVKTPEYSNMLNKIHYNNGFRAVIGHTRLPTKGSPEFNINNHPILANNIIGVHNGWITNDDALFKRYRRDVERAGQVDSEIIFRMIDYLISTGSSMVDAIQETNKELHGKYACAFVNKKNPRYLMLFCDDLSELIIYKYSDIGIILFASTHDIAKAALANNTMLSVENASYRRYGAGGIFRIDTQTFKIYSEELGISGGYRMPSTPHSLHIGSSSECSDCLEHRCLTCDHYALQE